MSGYIIIKWFITVEAYNSVLTNSNTLEMEDWSSMIELVPGDRIAVRQEDECEEVFETAEGWIMLPADAWRWA